MPNTHIVRARPPSRIPRPLRAAPAAALRVEPEPTRAALTVAPPARGMPAAATLRNFRTLVDRWGLAEGEAWTMLTGAPAPARRLTDEQASRVAVLMQIDAAMGAITKDVGAWLRAANPGPLLAGRSPQQFLTGLGTPGYVSLLRQVLRWKEM